MNRIKSVIPIMLAVFSLGANAQTKNTESALPPEVMAWTKSTLDVFSYKRYKSLKEAMIDNNYYVPLVFRGGIFPKLTYPDFGLPKLDIAPTYSLRGKPIKDMFASHLIRKSLEESVYKEMLKNPFSFKYTLRQLPGGQIKPESIGKDNSTATKLNVKPSTATPEKATSVTKFVPGRKYWTIAYQNDIKFTKNTSSKNWGNLNTMTLNIFNLMNYNYAKNKITFLNEIKTTQNINNAPNDTIRKYAFGSDELRIYSNFGVKAIGHWSYSVTGAFITRLFNAYRTNSEVKTAGMLAPFTLNVGLGMTFATNVPFKKPNRAFSVTATINPLSFDFVCSTDTAIAIGTYPDGAKQHVVRKYGSSVDINSNIRFNKIVTLSPLHINYFTNYETIKCVADAKLDIALSRYFSTTLQVWLQFDDARKLQEDEKILQIKELFSFGFAYRL